MYGKKNKVLTIKFYTMKAKKEPIYFPKAGDKVLICKMPFGNEKFEGKIGRVLSEGSSRSSFTVSIEFSNNKDYRLVLYAKANDYEFCAATPENRINFLTERAEQKLREVDKIKEEIAFIKKYPTEEDFVAYKLNKILKAKGPKDIATILKTMKESNYL